MSKLKNIAEHRKKRLLEIVEEYITETECSRNYYDPGTEEFKDEQEKLELLEELRAAL